MKIKTDFLLLAMILFATKTYAVDWLMRPEFNFSQRYTDNLRFQIVPLRSNLIGNISPRLTLGYLADNNELITQFKINQLWYQDQNELDFTEKLVNVNHSFTYERLKTGLNASYAEEASLSVQTGENGSGVLSAQVPRFTRSITPDISYQLTEKNNLRLSYSYLNATYAKRPNLSVGYADYINQQANAVLTHAFSPRLSFNLSGGYIIYDASNTFTNAPRVFPLSGSNKLIGSTTSFSQNSTTLTYQLGLNYSLTPEMSVSASAGIRDSNTKSDTSTNTDIICPIGSVRRNIFGQITAFCPNTNQPQNSTTNGKIYSGSLIRNFELGSITLSANQSLNPASTGYQQQTTSFAAQARYDLSERWSAGITGSYLISKAVVANSGNNSSNLANLNRDFIFLSPTVNWKFTQEINLEFNYSYGEQIYTASNSTATSNTVQLQFFYQPQTNRQVK